MIPPSVGTSMPISTVEAILVDTSAWFALLNKRDASHETLSRFFEKEKHYRYITTNYIIDETITLVRTKLGHNVALEAARLFQRGELARVIQVTEEIQGRAFQLFEKYSDKGFSFTDCTSFAVMELFAIQKALSLDRDFRQAGFIAMP